jgi:acyl-CoA thioesterase-2
VSDSLAEFLEVEGIAPDLYVSTKASPLSRPTLFGGALIAQSLRAAGHTAGPGMYPSSLHATFVRAGKAGSDLQFRVDRTRDGRSFATRQVVAEQDGRTLLTMTVSFHVDEPGGDFQPVGPVVPPPPADRSGDGPPPRSGSLGVDLVDLTDRGALPADAEYLAWTRSGRVLPDDRLLHSCVLAYLSDSGAPAVAATAIGLQAGGPDREAGSVRTTSLDHAMWFHRPGRGDDWVLVHGLPLSTAGSRGLVLGSISDRAGRRLASFTQEMLIRA